jgi:predicted nucleotidyltransferase
MDKQPWKLRLISDILDLPNLSTDYFPLQALITVKKRIAQIEEVGALILYGSVVRGEASPKSDIDILIVPLSSQYPESLKPTLQTLFNEIENEFNLKICFSFLIYKGDEDSYFLWETLKDGCVLFCRPEAVVQSIENINPYALISYNYKGLSAALKKRVHRFLYESKHGMLIDKANKMGYIAPSVLLLPISKSELITDFFDSCGINYSLQKIWR